MSENKIHNEDELWSKLSGETPAEEPKKEAKPTKEEKPAAPKEPKAPKGRIDGFFLACMAGVAAVSVAATLAISGMTGGSTPAQSGKPAENEAASSLELENAELRAQLELQKTQIKTLQEDLMNLIGSEEFLATAPSDPEQGNEVLDARLEAYDIYAQIQAAYSDFDRAKLEELIPEMDKRLTYLSTDDLNSYYLILEYVEQPSNG